jgi:hypothetical protein
MQDALIGTSIPQSHFANALLAPLHELNHRFLDLVASRGGEWRHLGGLRLSGRTAGQVAPLTAAQRAAAASCPYALFDLRFGDGHHWRARAEATGGPWRIAEQLGEDTAGFVRLALFYAWHVAATRQVAAQLLLGMTESTAAVFRSLAFNRLLALAASESTNLAARWSESDIYWSSLVSAASCTDGIRLRRVQLFGLQLAAAAKLR